MKFSLSDNNGVRLAHEYIDKIRGEGVVVSITKQARKRTVSQNALYWMWLSFIEKETGLNRNELHLLYRANFLSKDDGYIENIIIPDLWYRVKEKILGFVYFKGLDDIINIISHSTTSLDKREMTEYLESVRFHAAENMGIHLPLPEEVGYEEFINKGKWN